MIHCINQYPLAIKIFSQVMFVLNTKLANIAHTIKVGHILLILFLYQSLKDISFTDLPSVSTYPEAKKNNALPCTPSVAKDGFTSWYRGM